MPGRAGSSAWGDKRDGRQLECAIRPLGTDRLAAPLIWAVRGRVSAGGEDLDNHRGIDDRGDDLQVAAAVCAVFHIDIEHALEQAHAGTRFTIRFSDQTLRRESVQEIRLVERARSSTAPGRVAAQA